MTEARFSRSSIHFSQHSLVDGQLKTLKLVARRLQSALSTQETELQILQRLIYRNKNQHRGALFWRSVLEMRRYAECVDKLKLLDAVITLRSSFFANSPHGSSMKGGWTHFPHSGILVPLAILFRTAQALADKMAEANLRAYTSFHCSLQSAAFLHLMLIFVGISSRLRAVALELKTVCHDTTECIAALQEVETEESLNPDPPQSEPLEEQSHSRQVVESRSQPNSTVLFEHPMVPQLELQPASVAKIEIKSQKRPLEKTSSPKDLPKKKKKTRKDEIDDIFGF